MSQPSAAAKWSLGYITIGALTLVWTLIWYWYLHARPEEVQLRTWYFCYGLLGTGAVVLVIGLAVGQIGRQARHAELPPPEVKSQEAKIDQTAAARPVVMPAATPGAVVQPGRQPVQPSAVVPPALATPAPAAVPLTQPNAPPPSV
jgi:hypothetical protein